MAPTTPTTLRRRRLRWSLLAGACLLAALAVVAARAWQQSALERWTAAAKQVRDLDEVAADKAEALEADLRSGKIPPSFPPSSYKGLRLDNAERRLGTKLVRRNRGGANETFYVDPVSGGWAQIDDTVGYWNGVKHRGVNDYIGDPRVPAFPDPRRGVIAAVTNGVRVMCGAAYLAWIAVLIRFGASRRRPRVQRLGMAITLVELAVVAIFLSWFGPRYWSQRARGGLLVDMARVTPVVGATSVAIMIVTLKSHRAGRDDRPSCDQCGYDLTGNQSGICPECGTPTATRVA